MNFEWNHDYGALVSSLGCLHHSRRESSTKLIQIKTHEGGCGGETSLGFVGHPAASTVVVRVIFKGDVSHVENSGDRGVDRQSFVIRHSNIGEVLVNRLEVGDIIEHGIVEAPQLAMFS